MKKSSALIGVFFVSFLSATFALADDAPVPAPTSDPVLEAQKAPAFSEWRYAKLNSILSYLGVPPEPTFEDEAHALAGLQTRAEFEGVLAFFDPKLNIKRYATWDDKGVTVYLDRDTKRVMAYQVPFASTAADTVSWKNLTRDARHPLEGLRIALDPGHMGGPGWDEQTGKYMQIDGVRVSEGVIATHVVLLLKRDLEKLGAQVLLTRSAPGPVAGWGIDNFPFRTASREEVLGISDAKWFDDLLDSKPLGEELLKNASANPKLQNLLKETSDKRLVYYLKRVDIQARAKKINAFKPHITVVTHFDAFKSDQLQNTGSETRVYIPGNVFADEWASNQIRFDQMRAMLSGNLWRNNVLLASAIADSLSQKLGIPKLSTPTDFGGAKVVDGVYARNLALTRLINHGLISYIEILRYDYAKEFERLSKLDREAEVDGQKFKYSSRLDEAVSGITDGILNYVGTKPSDTQLP